MKKYIINKLLILSKYITDVLIKFILNYDENYKPNSLPMGKINMKHGEGNNKYYYNNFEGNIRAYIKSEHFYYNSIRGNGITDVYLDAEHMESVHFDRCRIHVDPNVKKIIDLRSKSLNITIENEW